MDRRTNGRTDGRKDRQKGLILLNHFCQGQGTSQPIPQDYKSDNTTNFCSRTRIKLQLKYSQILQNFKTIIQVKFKNQRYEIFSADLGKENHFGRIFKKLVLVSFSISNYLYQNSNNKS